MIPYLQRLLQDPAAIESRSFLPIPLVGGMDTATSKFFTAPGTLLDCLNYETTDLGYTRSEGLFQYYGVWDNFVTDMWYVGAPDAVAVGTFRLGEIISWEGGEGIFIWQGGLMELGIINPKGEVPPTSTVYTGSTSGATLDTTSSTGVVSATLADAISPFTSIALAGTVTTYLDFLVNDINLALTNDATYDATNLATTGKVPGNGPITGGWQFKELVYAVRDADHFIIKDGTEELFIGDTVKLVVDGTTTIEMIVGQATTTSGTAGGGDLVQQITIDPDVNSLAYSNIQAIVDDTIISLEVRNAGNTAIGQVGVDTGSLAAGGVLWYGTLFGWQKAAVGHTLAFKDGNTSPAIRLSPLFVANPTTTADQYLEVFFNNGTSDVATGTITSWQRTNEYDWKAALPNAEGWMSFKDISDVGAIVDGLTIYTEAAKAGDEVATVDGDSLVLNYLPSAVEMDSASSRYETRIANFYEDVEGEAIYIATGAGPAQVFNGEMMAPIYTPVPEGSDKPRHVEFHANYLALGFAAGTVLLSGVGVPNDFEITTGNASSWGVGDAVSGLTSMVGDALGIFCHSSSFYLQGRSAQDFSLKVLAPWSGAIEYTTEDINGPVFADFRGLRVAGASDKFGDFEVESISQQITPTILPRVQDPHGISIDNRSPVATIKVRNKSQYRLYFADGNIITMMYTGMRDYPYSFTQQHYDTENFSSEYVPTFIDSFVMDSGRERIVMGDTSGRVWIVDGAQLIIGEGSVVRPKCYLTVNPINGDAPHAINKVLHTIIEGQFFAAQDITGTQGDNYRYIPSIDDTVTDDTTVGSYEDPPSFELQPDQTKVYLPSMTDGYTIKLETEMDGSKPHAIQAILVRIDKTATDRNAAPKSY